MLKHFLILIIALMPLSSWAQINKCVIKGKTVYTNQKCPENMSESLKLPSLNISSSSSNSGSGSKTTRARYNSERWYKDHTGYKQALKVSAEKKVPIFIYGYTDWRGYCKKLHRDIFDDSTVKKTMSKFIKVKLNPEHSATDKSLFKSWGGRGYPTLYIQSPLNRSPTRTSGPFSKQNGKWKLVSTSQFIAMLEAKLN